MKKFLKTILFLCALSSLAYAEEDAMQILDRMREKIEKEEAEVAGYYEIMGEQKERPSIMDEQKEMAPIEEEQIIAAPVEETPVQ